MKNIKVLSDKILNRENDLKIVDFLKWGRKDNEIIIPVELYFPQYMYEFESGVYNFTMDDYSLNFRKDLKWMMFVIDAISKMEIVHETIVGFNNLHGYYVNIIYDRRWECVSLKNYSKNLTQIELIYITVIEFLDHKRKINQ